MNPGAGRESSISTLRAALKSRPDIAYAGQWFFVALLIGTASGLAAVVFFKALEWSVDWFSHQLAGIVPPVPRGDPGADEPAPTSMPVWYGLLLVPALGGLIAGVVTHFFNPDAEKGGTDAVLDAFHRQRGRLNVRSPLWKALASVVMIGSGGSVGREGPMVSLGAAIGSAIGRLFKMPPRERRIALLTGAAAGFASIFRAPLSGAIFAVESPYRNPEFEYRAFVPAIIGAVAAYVTFGVFYEFHPVFESVKLQLSHPLELALYAVFGLVCAGTGVLYVTILHAARERVFEPFFRRVHVPVYLQPAIGGLVLGGLAIGVPWVWGTGYGWVQEAIDGTLGGPGWYGVFLLFALALAKVVATSITYGSRGGEGVFGPAFFVGAMVGAGYGQLAVRLFPDLVTQPGAYVLVGMSGVFAGITKVPIAGLVMVCEITDSYALLLPLVLVCSLAYVFTGSVSLYRSQVGSRYDSPANLGEYSTDVLSRLHVSDAFKPSEVTTVRGDSPIGDVVRLVARTSQTTFPVVDGDQRLLGAVTVEDIREILFDTEIHRLVLVQEVARPFPTVTVEAPLLEALRKLTEEKVEEIPVVGPPAAAGAPPPLLGLLSRDQILGLYREQTEGSVLGP